VRAQGRRWDSPSATSASESVVRMRSRRSAIPELHGAPSEGDSAGSSINACVKGTESRVSPGTTSSVTTSPRPLRG
jgi:hypothetical protein